MPELNQSNVPQEFQSEPKPFKKAPTVNKASKEMIIIILLVVNLIISTIGLVGVAYTVSKEKARADQIGTLQNRGGMMFRNGGNFQGNFQGGFRQNGSQGQNGSTN